MTTSVVKQSVLLVTFSILSLFFKQQLMNVLHGLLFIHNRIASWLALVFSNDNMGELIQAIIALVMIPLIAGFLVALGFWLVKRHAMPHIMLTVWIVWTILLVTMLAQAG